jgi:hypothetical protein
MKTKTNNGGLFIYMLPPAIKYVNDYEDLERLPFKTPPPHDLNFQKSRVSLYNLGPIVQLEALRKILGSTIIDI